MTICKSSELVLKASLVDSTRLSLNCLGWVTTTDSLDEKSSKIQASDADCCVAKLCMLGFMNLCLSNCFSPLKHLPHSEDNLFTDHQLYSHASLNNVVMFPEIHF